MRAHAGGLHVAWRRRAAFGSGVGQNGVPVPPYGELCHDYYLKDYHEALTGTLSESAAITYFEPPPGPPSGGQIGTYPASVAQLAQIIASDPVHGTLFKFTVQGGQIVAVSGVCIP